MAAEPTAPKQRGRPFRPGQSGNPAGRPAGSRNRLGEDFVSALHEDFKTHGQEAVETVRKERPDVYLKVIATVIPKEISGLDGEPLQVQILRLSDVE